MFLVRLIVGVLRAIASLASRGPSVTLKLFDENGMEITGMQNISADKKRVITLRILDGKKRPGAKVEGVPMYTVVPTGIVSLFPASDGMSCEVGWIAPGTATVTCEGDADLGAGVKKITASSDFTTLEAPAEELELTVGPEVDL